MLIPLYGTALFFYILTLLTGSMGFERPERAFAAAALASNGAALFLMILVSGHAPVFELFESLLTVSFVIGLLAISTFLSDLPGAPIRRWAWAYILLLFGITLFCQKAPSPDVYDHNDPYIMLFHGFRDLAFAFMIYSSAAYLAFRRMRRHGSDVWQYMFQGRNLLLLGTVFFLCGEFTGIIWCLRGWGDFWMWKGSFFQSTLILFYLMIAFHIPGNIRHASQVQSLIGSMSGVVILSFVLMRGML